MITHAPDGGEIKFIASVSAGFIRMETGKRGGWKLEDAGEEAAANARLISAAPELLDACRRVLAALDKWSSETGGIMWVNPAPAVHESANELLKDVIAQAEGKTETADAR